VWDNSRALEALEPFGYKSIMKNKVEKPDFLPVKLWKGCQARKNVGNG
jgi:hypothetical protein